MLCITMIAIHLSSRAMYMMVSEVRADGYGDNENDDVNRGKFCSWLLVDERKKKKK